MQIAFTFLYMRKPTEKLAQVVNSLYNMPDIKVPLQNKTRPTVSIGPAAAKLVVPSVNRGLRDIPALQAEPLDANRWLSKVASYEHALKVLARELTQVRENESQKFAEHLHDYFGQDLLLVKLKLEQLRDSLTAGRRDALVEIINNVAGLIGQTRTFIEELYPRHVSEVGLNGALQILAGEMRTKHGLACNVKLDVMPKPLKDEVQQVLFRAVRELLCNVVKHARASGIKIVMTHNPGSVVIEVCDNGRGFNRHRIALSDLSIGKFGLFSIRARLSPLGGDLRLFSRVGRGTKAIITLPIDAAQ